MLRLEDQALTFDAVLLLPEYSEVLPKDWILKLTKKQALTWDEQTWLEKLQGSALKRIKPWMWRRNINSVSNNPEI